MGRRIWLAIAVCLLAACNSSSDREPSIGEAFVGPMTLQLRAELAARAALTATVKHGERLDLIGRRRRFVKVRTSNGAEGWVDGRLLLSPDQMADLRKLAERASTALSQGRASVFEPLNVHTVPNRQAPSFFQITPREQVEVLAHEQAPRAPFDPPDLIQSSPTAKALKQARKKKKEPEVPPPPPPKAPAVPDNWMEISGYPDGTMPEPEPVVEDKGKKGQAGKPGSKPADAKPTNAKPMDEWTLVRAKDGRAGWVLSRMLLMAIPDEVAQHAERARITSYFEIGKVNDHGESKPVWLWTVLAQRNAPYHFDGMRIFIWNVRRHRYETSYVERGLQGYLPLKLQGQNGSATSFTVVVRENDGTLKEREYLLTGFRAKLTARHPGELADAWYTPPGAPAPRPKPVEPGLANKAKGLIDGLKDKLKR